MFARFSSNNNDMFSLEALQLSSTMADTCVRLSACFGLEGSSKVQQNNINYVSLSLCSCSCPERSRR